MRRTVLVLGDSASAYTGGYFRNYLDHLAGAWSGDVELEIVNASAAGMTTADARVILERLLAAGERPDVAVIYLGNCDACGFGFLKSSAPRWLGTGWRRFRDRVYRRLNPLSVRSRRFTFSEQIPLVGFRDCVPVRDFADNIAAMIEAARRRRIGVILVNPTSKVDFVPCNNVGNFIFWKCFGVHDRHPYLASGEHVALRAALNLHGEGELEQALAVYRRILSSAGEDDEARHIALNNVAAIHHARGDFDLALEWLGRIPPRDTPMAALVLFNRGVALMRTGREVEAREAFALARETDPGTYRVKESYRQGVARVAERYAGGDVRYVDLAEWLGAEDYIDYCHPTDVGHRRVAEALVLQLDALLGTGPGDARCVIRNAPANPDAYLGFGADFFEHFGLVATPDPTQCERLLEEARARVFDYDRLLDEAAAAEHAAERWRLSILTHPLFGTPEVVAASPPREAVDQGRLPDWYFLRHMLAVYERASERLPWLEALPHVAAFVPDAARIRTSLAAVRFEALAPSLDALRVALGSLDAERVLDRALRLLAYHLLREPSVHSRYRTVSYWFFRESLLFGSTSHPSCYFDRIAVTRVLDSCLFVVTLGSDDGVAARFRRLLELVEEVLASHAGFLEAHARAPYLIPDDAMRAQRERLRALLASPLLSGIAPVAA